MTDTAIYIKGLHKSYAHVHALKGVSLEIQKGEFFGLLGPNGAGKSTLINILAGLVKKDSGEILVQGYDTVKDYRKTRRFLGVVPQEIVYDPFFQVEEVLKIQGGYFGVRYNKVWIEELLEILGLINKRYANLRDLSGGMKRRLLIAQALVHKPPIAILDEPTAGVDVEQRHALWTFIKRLNKEGHTILLTTHYLEEAEHLCDRIAIIDQGEVKALDTKTNLIRRSHNKTITFTASEPITLIPDTIKDLVTQVDGDRFTVDYRQNGHTVFWIFDKIKESGIKVVDLETNQPRLEDVFVKLTQRVKDVE
jgi:ABC-2 type transport system ATP-binding protein